MPAARIRIRPRDALASEADEVEQWRHVRAGPSPKRERMDHRERAKLVLWEGN